MEIFFFFKREETAAIYSFGKSFFGVKSAECAFYGGRPNLDNSKVFWFRKLTQTNFYCKRNQLIIETSELIQTNFRTINRIFLMGLSEEKMRAITGGEMPAITLSFPGLESAAGVCIKFLAPIDAGGERPHNRFLVRHS